MREVMNTIGFSFLSKKVKAVAKGAFSISKSIVKTMFRLQFNAFAFPAYFFYGGVTYIYNRTCTSKKENASSLEPKSDDVVDAVKKLRNSVLSGMSAIGSSRCDTNHLTLNDSAGKDQENVKYEKFPDLSTRGSSTVERLDENSKITHLGVSEVSGSDIMWDIPIISAKASYFVQCLGERNEDFVEAKRALEEHAIKSTVPSTRREYNEMIEKSRNTQNYSEKSFEKRFNDKPIHLEECCANDNMFVDSNVNEQNVKQVNFRVNELSLYSARQKAKLSCNRLPPQNKIMCRELVDINKTLRKMRLTCSKLLEGLVHLNDSLAKVISMREKLTTLEFQVDEGKKLLQVVEADRSIMKAKLSVLEKLITEEEKFLCGDTFCESGFYESDNLATTGEL